MNNITTFNFEGRPFTVIEYKGRPAFTASEIGERFGYDQISRHISQNWSDELEPGKDYVVLSGQELVDFKKLAEVNPELGFSRVANITLLFESGVNIIALLSRKPEARRLRRFLADEVLPQLARDGRFSPDRAVIGGEVRTKTRTFEQSDWRSLREQRLSRQQTARGLEKALQLSDNLSESEIRIYQVRIAEVLAGQRFPELLPAATTATWRSAEDIAHELGVTAHRVGLTVSAIWGRERQAIPGVMEGRMSKAAHNDSTVVRWFYSPQAVGRIRAAIERPEQSDCRELPERQDTDEIRALRPVE